MQWYLKDEERLKLEIYLMEMKGVNFQLHQDEEGNLLWRGPLSVLGHYHDDVKLVYTENFPYEPIVVYVLKPKLPRITIHVHEDGRICYIKPQEWNAGWTAYAVYLRTVSFLHEFYSGKMCDYSPLITHRTFQPRQRKGLLGRLMEIF